MLPWILHVSSKAIQVATCGLQGISMIIFSASCRWPAQPCRCNVPFCKNHIVSDHWRIQVHAFIHQTCMATSRHRESKVISSGCTPLHIHSKCLSFPTMPMHGTSFKYDSPSDHISRWHLVKHSPSILNVPTFCIHVNQSTPHKDIHLQTNLNDVMMTNTPVLFRVQSHYQMPSAPPQK
jgi:hypothetical protein